MVALPFVAFINSASPVCVCLFHHTHPQTLLLTAPGVLSSIYLSDCNLGERQCAGACVIWESITAAALRQTEHSTAIYLTLL